MSDDEITPGGSRIQRYETHEHEFRPPEAGADHVEELTGFLEEFLGQNSFVWHEIVSDKVHIDVLAFSPSTGRNFWTFVTSGMSDLPMEVPEAVQDPKAVSYSELVISLPADWFETDEDGSIPDRVLRDGERYWPIRELKWTARFPHEYGTWIWLGHSIPNGDPAEPFADNTTMSGVVLLPLITWPEEKLSFRRSDGERVNFLGIYPVYDDEMRLKLERGTEALETAFAGARVTEVLDISRQSAARKRGFFDFLRK